MAISQLLEEDKQPPIARQSRADVSGVQQLCGSAEIAPRTEKALPRSAYGLVQALAAREMVVALRIETIQILIAADDSLQKIRRKKTTLGPHRHKPLQRSEAHSAPGSST